MTRVRETGAEVGIALDGDADRVGAVDGQGRILWGDQLACCSRATSSSASPARPS